MRDHPRPRVAGDHGGLHLPVHRRHGQVGAGAAARLAAGFDGRPDADLRADPCRHDGDRGHLHGGAHVAAVRAVGDRARLVLVIGATTAFFMGLLGIVNNDIKRVVAYSTLSQLGYMTVALGVSAYAGAIFHLMTHAFFKALLFLAAGSVIIAHASRAGHAQDGRAARSTCRSPTGPRWIGSLALIGFPGTSGFFSKDALIEAVHESHTPGAQYAYWCVLLGVFVTAFYTLPAGVHDVPRPGALRARRHEPGITATRHARRDDTAQRTSTRSRPRRSRRTRAPGWSRCRSSCSRSPRSLIGWLHDRAGAVRRLLRRLRSSCAEQHDVLGEIGEEFHGPARSCCMRSRSRRCLARARGRRCAAWFLYIKRPDLPARIARSCPLALHSCSPTSTTSTSSTRACSRGGSRGARARRCGECGDVALIDGALVNGSARSRRLALRRVRRRAVGLSVSLRFRDDHRPVGAARLVRAALIARANARIDACDSIWPLLSLLDLAADRRRPASLLALGERAIALGRWLALADDGRRPSCYRSRCSRLRRRDRGDAVRRAARRGSRHSTPGTTSASTASRCR